MPFEQITVVADSGVYSDWETVVIEQDTATDIVNIMLSTTEITPVGASTVAAFDKWNFPPGTIIEVFANGDFVARAAVWQYAPSADAEQHSITITAKNEGSSINLSSIVSDTGGYYENKGIWELVQAWAQPLGLTVTNDSDNSIVPVWQIRQGATIYAESMRMLKNYGHLLHGMMDGGISVSAGKALGVQGPIVQGENILKMSARLTDEDAVTKVLGQTPYGTDLKQNLQPGAMAQSFLARNRTKIILEPAVVDVQRAQTRAAWEAQRSSGASLQCTVTVPGWHSPAGESFVPKNVPYGREASSGGPIWVLLADVYVFAPWLKVNCTLRTSRIVFKQSLAEGSVTELTLVDPTSLEAPTSIDPAGATPCNSGSMWNRRFDINTLGTIVDTDFLRGGGFPG
jgi:prophage tail gpP-like protein